MYHSNAVQTLGARQRNTAVSEGSRSHLYCCVIIFQGSNRGAPPPQVMNTKLINAAGAVIEGKIKQTPGNRR